jgi:hypothetical protein
MYLNNFPVKKYLAGYEENSVCRFSCKLIVLLEENGVLRYNAL